MTTPTMAFRGLLVTPHESDPKKAIVEVQFEDAAGKWFAVKTPALDALALMHQLAAYARDSGLPQRMTNPDMHVSGRIAAVGSPNTPTSPADAHVELTVASPAREPILYLLFPMADVPFLIGGLRKCQTAAGLKPT